MGALILAMLMPADNALSMDPAARKKLVEVFQNPPPDCWPHTRWWWPGNPVSREEITWELEQMRSVGIRGVEQITMGPVYEKGNITFLSEEYLDMIQHTVKEAKRLGMEVSLNFGGPGWIIGVPWLEEEDRIRDMVPTSVNVIGPGSYHSLLPDSLTRTERSWEIFQPVLSGSEKLIAVVAGKQINGKIDPESLTDITAFVHNRKLNWKIPEGSWKIMAFWLATHHEGHTLDHFNKEAVGRYCEDVGGRFESSVGHEFGKTVDSFFCDSFELPNLASGIYWSESLLEAFREYHRYDLTPFLPAIWWEVGDISPKIRYDTNLFLHHAGMEAFFRPFLGWCSKHGVKGRIQPYGFTTDNIAAAGMTPIPEMEITPGEKDAAPWFDTRIGPKKYVASGAHLYGRNTVSVEAYTFMHWERYRTTLEELKIATDGYLRSGANKFYNHGYSYLPERDIAPSRTIPFAVYFNPVNPWWKQYSHLALYIARCCMMLRQGHFAPDIALYSPLANQWTLNVLNSRKWTRDFDWGELGFLLISNGYDFDILNDEAIQALSRFENQTIHIREMDYKVLLLPDLKAIPLETLERIALYVREGGVVIALDRLPEASTGFLKAKAEDTRVLTLVQELFREPSGRDGTGEVTYGRGKTYTLRHVIDRKIWWDERSSALDPFLNVIRTHIQPDFGIDFAHEGIRKNEGLTFFHRKSGDSDIYFVSNIQDRKSTVPVTFRISGRSLWEWNPYTGDVRQLFHYEDKGSGTVVPLSLAPYESTILVFEPGPSSFNVEKTGLEIEDIKGREIHALADRNGIFRLDLKRDGESIPLYASVTDLPAPFEVEGPWDLVLDGPGYPEGHRAWDRLLSWTDNPELRHFSGTGRYTAAFRLPESCVNENVKLILDPGRVCNTAEILLNGVRLGTVWMRGQELDMTGIARAGENRLDIHVTNTLINRVAGLKDVPPVPEELVPRFGSGMTSESGRRPAEMDFVPLPASGLLGPVIIRPQKKIKIDIKVQE